MRRKPKRRRPDIVTSTEPGNVSDMDLGAYILPVEEYHIISWSPGDAAAGDPCTQVHIIHPLKELNASMVLRLKSRRATEELIDVLTEHMDFVWPET